MTKPVSSYFSINRLLNSFFLSVLLCLFSACAFNAQAIKISPMMTLPSSDIGKGRDILLNVVDERPKQVIGHRGTAYGAAAEITSSEDVAVVIREKVSAGLSANGFKVVTGSSSARTSMKVEIRLIEYTTSTGFWTGGVHTRAAFKGICRNGRQDYENLYRQENEERVMVVPDAETNEQWINLVVGQALDKIFSDRQMLECLSG
jgi:uncharacterized lipoprotein